jgi:hypothetical protein
LLRGYEEIGEKAIHWSIGVGESYLATAMYIVELADQMKIDPKDLVKSSVEPTAMAKSNARRKVNDVMGMSDQSRKSWMFQNRTSSPGMNALWRSMMRFSNQTASLASNTSVAVPILFDSKADAETKQEALENMVTTLTQNVLFNPFKLAMLVPIVAHLLYLVGGDDDDKAQKKAQAFANKMMAVDKDSSMIGEVIKTLAFGKKRELFDQEKKPDAAQASAMAEIGSKTASELLTSVPVFGAAFGYSAVSGLSQRFFTNPLATSAATFVHNASNGFDKKQLKKSSFPYDKRAVTIRSYDQDWDQSLAGLTAPSQMLHDIGSAAWLTAEYGMTRQAQQHRAASLVDMAVYVAMEFIPFARDARSLKKSELREAVRKDSKRK